MAGSYLGLCALLDLMSLLATVCLANRYRDWVFYHDVDLLSLDSKSTSCSAFACSDPYMFSLRVCTEEN